MGSKEELDGKILKANITLKVFSQGMMNLFTHGITYGMTGLGFLQGWIDFIHSLARFKVHLLILCIRKLLKILLSWTTTWSSFFINLSTSSPGRFSWMVNARFL